MKKQHSIKINKEEKEMDNAHINMGIKYTLMTSICEALEIPVVKDGDLKLPVDELVVRNYDKTIGYAGRARKPMVDWVTEYNYVSEKSLTEDEFMKLIKDNGHELYGSIYPPVKKKLTFGNGKIYYRHIIKTVMY